MANRQVTQSQYRAAQARGISRPAAPKTRKRRRRVLPFILVGFAIVLFTVAIFIAKNYSDELKYREKVNETLERQEIYEGVMIDGLSLGGLTVDKARTELKSREQAVTGRVNITAQYGDRVFHITADDVGFAFNTEEILRSAWDIGRVGDDETRYAEILSVAEESQTLAFKTTIDEQRLRSAAARIAAQINVPCVDAVVTEFDYDSKTFLITAESSGIKVDESRLADAIVSAVVGGDFGATIPIQAESIEPQVTKMALDAIMGQMSTFSTTTTKAKERNNNIRLAAAAVTEHGMLMPGETFSFNKATGDRSLERGYQEAGAFRNGVLVPEPGGGVCQVSSTLFNAFIASGLSTEDMVRSSHSMTVSYVPIGHDAAVDQTTGKDFRFTNPTDEPIWIVMNWNSETRELTAEFFGERILEPGMTREMRTETTETIEKPEDVYLIDPSLRVGESVRDDSGHVGYRVTTFLVLKQGDTVISDKQLFKSHYHAAPAQYRHNPGVTVENIFN